MLEDIKTAQKVFEKAASKSFELIEKGVESGEKTAEGAFYLGMAAYELRLYSIAVSFLKHSYNTNPSSEAASRLAMSHWRSSELEDAEEWILRAIQSNPKGQIKTLLTEQDVSYLSIYATILLDRGRIEEALQSATAALTLIEKDTSALLTRASANLMKNNFDEVIFDMNRAIAITSELGRTKFGTQTETLEFKRIHDLAINLKEADIAITPLVYEKLISAHWPD